MAGVVQELVVEGLVLVDGAAVDSPVSAWGVVEGPGLAEGVVEGPGLAEGVV